MNYREMSLEELERLAATKDGQALCELGRRYRFGESGVEKNYTASYRMYHKAEKLNMREAFIALGQMYEKGEYFARNQQLAQEYYDKASALPTEMGSATFVHPTEQKLKPQPSNQSETQTSQPIVQQATQTSTAKSVSDFASANIEDLKKTQTTTTSSSVVTKNDVTQSLKRADTIRSQGDTAGAKLYVQQAVDQLNTNRGSFSADDIVELEAHINWLYAYIAFNEQKYADFEKYVFQNGVKEYFPWSTYLVTVVHRMLNANVTVLSQDAQNMLNVLNNPKLETTQLGDVLGLLGDLCLMGISTAGVNPTEQAYGFYENAANAGNKYASEQLKKFTKNMFGKLVYKER